MDEASATSAIAAPTAPTAPTATKEYLVLLETQDAEYKKDFKAMREWGPAGIRWHKASIDYLKTQGYDDIPGRYRFVYQPTNKKAYLIYGKGVPFENTDECFDDDTEFIVLKMKDGVWSTVTNKKKLLRYRVYLTSTEVVRTKDSKPLVMHCDACDHPREFSMGPCDKGCPCCWLNSRPIPEDSEPEPESETVKNE
ncbi:hypothetical protein GGF42_007956 [Coemansia sp. RSA 2424]|nr:hypothetical protein GGF42_007956 [Coemansia sp. RSA 2424]